MRPEIEEDIGGLADQQLAGPEKRRRKRRMLDFLAIEQAEHRAFSAGPSGDIDIFGASLFQRQADELAAPLNPVPVIELIAHIGLLCCPLTPTLPSPRGRGGSWDPLTPQSGEG